MSTLRFKYNNPIEVRRTLARVSNMVANGQMDPKRGNTIITACNAILGAIRTDEQEKKIIELAEIMERMSDAKKERP